MIKIYKTNSGIVLENDGYCFVSHQTDWDEYINRDHLFSAVTKEITGLEITGNADWIHTQKILPPVGSQEVWAAGVTYLRSKTARMEESKESGGATFYDKVYEAERPELFFKSTGHRVVGPNDFVRIREDSKWDVPEPELTLLISSSGKIVGYTIGNDMSSRSIEGENPLYLPQAKVYNGSAALGPCVLVTEDPIPSTTGISMTVRRNDKIIFEGSTTIDQMKRSHEELVEFLYRECSFPVGCYLMTGTCVVPGNEFTLQSKDHITITIDRIGVLINIVE
jgi:2-dehydro-3-deoxy-D-arabinonate dehydratase